VNLLASAIQGMASTLARAAGYPGTYDRYSGGSVDARGIVVERDYEVIDDEGIVTLVKSFDWIFRTEELARLLPPKPRDRFRPDSYGLPEREGQDLQECYEAMTIGKKPCYEPHDAHGVMVVVHMQRISE